MCLEPFYLRTPTHTHMHAHKSISTHLLAHFLALSLLQRSDTLANFAQFNSNVRLTLRNRPALGNSSVIVVPGTE